LSTHSRNSEAEFGLGCPAPHTEPPSNAPSVATRINGMIPAGIHHAWRPASPQTGKPIEKPRQLTNWSGFCMNSPSFSADGKRLTFVRSSPQSTLYVAEQQEGGTYISTPSRVSNRKGHPELFRQLAGEETVEPIAARLEDSATDVQVSPMERGPSTWLIHTTGPSQ